MLNKTRIIILYFEWENTKENHAGMAYLVRKMKEEYPSKFRLIKIPDKWDEWKPKLKRAYQHMLVLWLQLWLRLNKNTSVLFMEYLGSCSGNMTGIAQMLRKQKIENQLLGLVHLSPRNLNEIHTDEASIKEGCTAVDKLIVFGSSLAKYFEELGFSDKVHKTFHYVENRYYQPQFAIDKKESLRVICMGTLKRNYQILKEIVAESPFAEFEICMGKSDLSHFFKDFDNVKLHGFLKEDSLLGLMQKCDVSLSVLSDTIGSNVIVTSMACGLVNVVSDVGSIRDYCTENDSVLCQNSKHFSEALKALSSDSKLLSKLKSGSLKKSNDLTLKKSIIAFTKIIDRGVA